MNRDNSSDIVKGIALYLVVLGHLVVSYGRSFIWIFSFHMPLFFFMSGYFFQPEKYSFGSFVKQKIKTILIPLFVFMLVGMIVVAIVPTWDIHLYENPYFLIFYHGQPEPLRMGQLWFLWALFWASVFFYLLHQMGKKLPENGKVLAFVVLAYLATNLLVIYSFPRYGRYPLKIDTACTATIFYGAGYAFRKKKILEALEEQKYLVTIFTCIIVTIVSRYNGNVNMSDCMYSNWLLFYIAAFAGIIMINMIARMRFIRESKILAYYGRNTLPMFALHSLLLFAAAWLLRRVTGQMYEVGGIPFKYSVLLSILVYVCLAPIGYLYNCVTDGIRKVTKGVNHGRN